MDRYAKQISTGKIIHIQSGGDSNRPQLMSDNDWETLKATRLDTVRQQAINQGIPANDIEVGWSDKVERQNFQIQIAEDAILNMTWKDKRKQDIADGGYGTSTEQFEFLCEQGIGAYQSHINTVKSRYPKE